MRNRERAAVAWRALLFVALGAFALAAVATEFGNDALSRFAGTAGWAAGIVGAVIGLLVETKRGTAP
jgi:Na+-transporting NADH:ubiquinone oxidoreductase subunit NqrB